MIIPLINPLLQVLQCVDGQLQQHEHLRDQIRERERWKEPRKLIGHRGLDQGWGLVVCTLDSTHLAVQVGLTQEFKV